MPLIDARVLWALNAFTITNEARGYNYTASASLEKAFRNGFFPKAAFNYGVDMKKALFDVQALMNVVQANLPATGANLKPSWVVPVDPLNLPVLKPGDPCPTSVGTSKDHEFGTGPVFVDGGQQIATDSW